jgi:hypothetical protein
MRIPRVASLVLCALLVTAGVAGCASRFPNMTATPAPAASAPPAPSPIPPAVAAPGPTCENLWTPVFLERAAANGYTLEPGYTGSPTEGFADLKPFLDRHGLVCIWGSPDRPEQPSAYAWSPIDAASAASIQTGFDPGLVTRTESASGAVFSFESSTDVGRFHGYLFRSADWFFSTDVDDLEAMAARFDAL